MRPHPSPENSFALTYILIVFSASTPPHTHTHTHARARTSDPLAPVQVASHGSRPVEGGFAAYDLVANYDALVRHLEKQPLEITLREVDEARAGEERRGASARCQPGGSLRFSATSPRCAAPFQYGSHTVVATGTLRLALLLGSVPVRTSATTTFLQDADIVLLDEAQVQGQAFHFAAVAPPPVAQHCCRALQKGVAVVSATATLQDLGPAEEGEPLTFVNLLSTQPLDDAGAAAAASQPALVPHMRFSEEEAASARRRLQEAEQTVARLPSHPADGPLPTASAAPEVSTPGRSSPSSPLCVPVQPLY
jgi:hypothetical protein